MTWRSPRQDVEVAREMAEAAVTAREQELGRPLTAAELASHYLAARTAEAYWGRQARAEAADVDQVDDDEPALEIG